MAKNVEDKVAVWWRGKTCTNLRLYSAGALVPTNAVDKYLSEAQANAVLHTFCAQSLHIQSLLNFGECSTDLGIDPRFLFDLFDGVDGGSMVFAAKFAGNLWKTQV